MLFKKEAKKFSLLLVVQFVLVILIAQPGVPSTKWTADGSSYYAVEKKGDRKDRIAITEQNCFYQSQTINY